MAADEPQVPRSLLVSFLTKATQALESYRTQEEEWTLVECKQKILQLQSQILEQVVEQQPDEPHFFLVEQVQTALASLTTTYSDDNEIQTATDALDEAARIALARLVLTCECLRTDTTSLMEPQPPKEEHNSSLEATIHREAILEFCALCQAAIRIPSVQAHLQNPFEEAFLEGLEKKKKETQPPDRALSTPPPIQRIENLQRLIWQAMGYNAEEGLKELARIVQTGGTDDLELLSTIQKTTTLLLDASLREKSTATTTSTNILLSDQHYGGVTRVVSVQHSEQIVPLEGSCLVGSSSSSNSGAAPISQSMRGNETLLLAQKAAALRESLGKELFEMSDEDRQAMLQQAQEALEEFQKRAMELPTGPERILFLRNMDDKTQKLLAMHRIWQEHLASRNE